MKKIETTKLQKMVLAFLKKSKNFPGYTILKHKFGSGVWNVVNALKEKGLVSKKLK